MKSVVHSHPRFTVLRQKKWRLFIKENVRHVVLLEIKGKNSGKMARKEVFMTAESFGFMNFGWLRFPLWPNNRKPTEKSVPVTTLPLTPPPNSARAEIVTYGYRAKIYLCSNGSTEESWVDLTEVPSLWQAIGFSHSVVIRYSMVSGSLDVQGHEITSGELQRSKDIAYDKIEGNIFN